MWIFPTQWTPAFIFGNAVLDAFLPEMVPAGQDYGIFGCVVVFIEADRAGGGRDEGFGEGGGVLCWLCGRACTILSIRHVGGHFIYLSGSRVAWPLDLCVCGSSRRG